MLFEFARPAGIEGSLLLTFILMGVLAVFLAAARGDRALVVTAAIHSSAGALTLLAADLITLLVAWEFLTLSAYVIIRQGDGKSGGAAFWYLAAQISAAAFFFVAIVAHAGATASIDVAPLAPRAQPFMMVAVLVKTAMMPLHGWLIGSYTRATHLGSFVLSAYATKVGVLTAARTLSFSFVGFPLLSYIGALMAVLAVIAALRQHSARRLLSYHIISQVGYMLAGVGLVGSTLGVTAGLFHSINHILYKGLLFLVAGVAAAHYGHDDLRRMGGLARKMPLVFLCGVVGAAAIVGLPLTSGYVSKELLKKSVDAVQMALLIAASVGTALSFTKFIYLIFLRLPSAEAAAGVEVRAVDDGAPKSRAPIAAVTVLAVLALLSVLIGTAPRLVPGAPIVDYYSLTSILWSVAPAVSGFLLWFPLRSLLIRGSRRPSDKHRRSTEGSGEHGSLEPELRGYLQRGFLPLLSTLRGAYRIDPQRAVSIAVVGLVSFVLIVVFI